MKMNGFVLTILRQGHRFIQLLAKAGEGGLRHGCQSQVFGVAPRKGCGFEREPEPIGLGLFHVAGLFQGEQDANVELLDRDDFGDLLEWFAIFAIGQRFKNGHRVDDQVDVVDAIRSFPESV